MADKKLSDSDRVHEAERFRERAQNKLGRFGLGRRVFVEGASGGREHGWMVQGFNEENQKVILRPFGGGPNPELKEVSLAELEQWNPE